MTPIQNHDEYLAAARRLNEIWGAGLTNAESDELIDRLKEYETEVLHMDTPEAFAIDTEERLEWFVGKVADLESKRKRVLSQAAAMVKDIDNQLAGIKFRYGQQAEDTLRSLLNGRSKSRKFLTGTVGVRKTPARVSVQDHATLYAELPEDLRDEVSVHKIDPTILNRMVKVVDGHAYRTDTGEDVTVNGLKVVDPGEAFYVKTGDESDE